MPPLPVVTTRESAREVARAQAAPSNPRRPSVGRNGSRRHTDRRDLP